jgi:hypothetical protein
LVGAEQDLRDAMHVKSLLQLATRCCQLLASSGRTPRWLVSDVAGSSFTTR